MILVFFDVVVVVVVRETADSTGGQVHLVIQDIL